MVVIMDGTSQHACMGSYPGAVLQRGQPIIEYLKYVIAMHLYLHSKQNKSEIAEVSADSAEF